MCNILCNTQEKLFFPSRSYSHKGQGSPNEFLKNKNHLISSSNVLWQIFNFYSLLECR
jgi:hypothetical protein